MLNNIADDASHLEACWLLLAGRYDEALQIIGQLPETPETLNDLAVTLHQLGRTEDGLVHLDKALGMQAAFFPAMMNEHYMSLAREAALQPPSFRVLEDSGPPVGKAPAISVIIPTYDRPQCLPEAVKSILGQTCQDFEIIVVSDGGPEQAGEIMRRLGTGRMRCLRIEHSGISGALNAGLAHARGAFIAYLDDDDIYYPDHLQTLGDYLTSHSDACIAYSLALRCVQKMINHQWVTKEKSIANAGNYARNRLIKNNFIITTGSIMHRREMLDDVGGFNEKIIGCQDWEYYLRISKKYPLHHVAKATLEHRKKNSPGAQFTSNRRMMRRNLITVRYMHNLMIIPSRYPDRKGYAKILRRSADLMARWPDLIDFFDLTEPINQQPFDFYYQLGFDLILMREYNKALRAFLNCL